MIFILTLPMTAYILMLLTVGFLVSMGVDKNSLDALEIWVIEIQLLLGIWLFRKVKGWIDNL
jgi:hypothetical protein